MAGHEPFFTGGPIPTEQAATFFHGFEEEQRSIIQYLKGRAPVRLGIAGAPGSGKTSLLLSVAHQIPPGRVHLDCSRIWPANVSAVYRLLCEALGAQRPAQPLPEAPAEAYRKLALPRRPPPGVFVFENVEGLRRIEPALLDDFPVLAVRLPYHVVLTGKERALQGLVTASVHLRPFSEGSASHFLRRRFESAGLAIDEAALPVFYEFTRGAPDDLQRLGRVAWENVIARGATRVGAEDAERAVGDLVDRLPSRTLAPWAALRGLMRDIFICMCVYDLGSPTEIARRLGLEPKNVVVLLARLAEAHGIIERVGRGTYRVGNPLLKHHVRKEYGSPILR